MKFLNALVIFAVIVLLAAAGCRIANDLYPTHIPRDTLAYVGEDPNDAGIGTVGRLRGLREEVITKHIVEQSNLAHDMEIDKALYGRAIEQANLNIEIAEAERATTIGTIQSPGWLLSLILGGTGFGAYFAGYRTQRKEDYTEAEVQELLRTETKKK